MSREHLKFIVVGSVDHGKSTLIGRFLYDTGSLPESQLDVIRRISGGKDDERVEFAFVLDHLEEERANRITIDTAQTFFSSDRRDYVIIDAPGHREFLKNMITGASQASAALLLLDVHEGLQEQTHRHAYMLSLLGVRQLIVVLNKMDLIDYREEVFADKAPQMRELLSALDLDHLAVIPVSALEGDNIVKRSANMPWYDGPTVIESLDLLEPDVTDESLPLRLPVQDVYQIGGRDIAVGRVAAGHLTAGTPVTICPAATRASIASVEKFEERMESAAAGESIGFTLSDGEKLRRGMTLCDPEDPPNQEATLTGSVFWMSPDPLRTGDKISLRLATQEVPCSVERIANRIDSGTLQIISEHSDELCDTEVAEVTLTGQIPINFDGFSRIREMGRFVLMRRADIVAGGIIP